MRESYLEYIRLTNKPPEGYTFVDGNLTNDKTGRIINSDESKLDLMKEYYDQYLLSGVKLYHKLKQDFENFNIGEVIEFVKSTDHSVTSNVRSKGQYAKIRSKVTNKLWMIDLIYTNSMYPSSNYNITYLLNCIDIHSKYAYSEPLRKKDAESVANAFEKILDRIAPNKPKFIQSDNGLEWEGEFAKLLKDRGIFHRFSKSHSPTTNAGIERFNGTLKRKIKTYLIANKTKIWYDELQNIIDQYNNTVHETTGKTPQSVVEGEETIDMTDFKRETKATFKVGDIVRLAKHTYNIEARQARNNKLKNADDGINWSFRRFRVVKVAKYNHVYKYTIALLDDSKELKRTYYGIELQHSKERLDSLENRDEPLTEFDFKGDEYVEPVVEEKQEEEEQPVDDGPTPKRKYNKKPKGQAPTRQSSRIVELQIEPPKPEPKRKYVRKVKPVIEEPVIKEPEPEPPQVSKRKYNKKPKGLPPTRKSSRLAEKK